MRRSVLATAALAAALLLPSTGHAFGMSLPCDDAMPLVWLGPETDVVRTVGCPAAVLGGVVGLVVSAPPSAALASLGVGEGPDFSGRFLSLAGPGAFVGGQVVGWSVLTPIHLPKWLILDPLGLP